MNKHTKTAGAIVLSLGSVFMSACSIVQHRTAPANDNPPAPIPATSDVKGLSRMFNSVSDIPVFVVDQNMADSILAFANALKTPPQKLLRDQIASETGVTLHGIAIEGISQSIATKSPISARNPVYDEQGNPAKSNLCVVYATLPGDPAKGTLHAMMSLSKEDVAKTIPQLDSDSIVMSAENGERMIKLHEGFHCTDSIYAGGRLELHKKMGTEALDYQQSSDLRLQVDLATNNAETFADVAALLKMAQEGKKEITAAHAATRAAAQAHGLVTRAQDTRFAVRVLASMAGIQASPGTGWPDNLVYVSYPGLIHNTTKGVLAAADYINATPEETLRKMSMADIKNKAYEITASVALTPDQWRGLNYVMWSAPRRIVGETTGPFAEKLCAAPCASAITAEQRTLGVAAMGDYIQTTSRALIPFAKQAPAHP